MAKKYIVELSSKERNELKDLINKGKAAAYKRKHPFWRESMMRFPGRNRP